MTYIAANINPYWGKDLFGFIGLFFKRLCSWIFGDLTFDQLASDEIQVLVLVVVSISSCLVGPFLVLKRMTMLANSLSHTILLGIVLAFLLMMPFTSEMGHESLGLEVLLIASLVTGLLTTVLTQVLTQVMKLQEDASIGLVFTTLFALGIVLVTLYTRNTHLGVEAIMGNVDALHANDLKLISWVALFNFAILFLFFKEYKITTFDPGLSRSQGISPTFFNHLLMVQVAATAIGAFRAVGVILVLAFFAGPFLFARLFTHRLKTLIFISVGGGVLCSFLGVALSRHILSVYHLPLSTAGLVVTLIAVLYLLAIIISLVKRQRSAISAKSMDKLSNKS